MTGWLLAEDSCDKCGILQAARAGRGAATIRTASAGDDVKIHVAEGVVGAGGELAHHVPQVHKVQMVVVAGLQDRADDCLDAQRSGGAAPPQVQAPSRARPFRSAPPLPGAPAAS